MSAIRALPGLRLDTLNVSGLSGRKLVKLISWMREQHLDGMVLTETKTAESPEDLFRREPGSEPGSEGPGRFVAGC